MRRVTTLMQQEAEPHRNERRMKGGGHATTHRPLIAGAMVGAGMIAAGIGRRGR
jgi:hypothetical protein